MLRNLIIFANGTSAGGGTGAENLLKCLPGRVLMVVSNHENGGVRRRTESVGAPFMYFPGPYTEEGYAQLIEKICLETGKNETGLWYALSGWFRRVYWLSPARTFNIHSALLPRFAGLWGEKLHATVWEAYQKGEISESEIVMHFVTEEYDKGPIFFRFRFPLRGITSYEEYREHVRGLEHKFQPLITELVVRGGISWNGTHSESLITPFK
jgi:folate-dependent phosphoribosylglycinamide formyltransferase PurN